MCPAPSIPALVFPISTPFPQHFQMLSLSQPRPHCDHPYPYTVPSVPTGLYPRPHLQLIVQ